MTSASSFISSSSKLTLLRYVVCLCVICAAGDVVTKALIVSVEISGASKVNRIIHDDDPNEVPVFGSSRAQTSYVPALFSADCFNYGIDGIGFRAVEFFLTTELEKTRRTPIIVNLDYEWWHTRIGDISNYVPNANAREVRALLGDEFTFQYRIPLIRYYGRFEAYAGYYLNERMSLTKVTDRGGQFLVAPLTAAKFNQLVEERLKAPYTFSVDAAMDARFRALLASHPERQFVVAVAPYHSSYLRALTNRDAAKRYVGSLKAYANVAVVDRSDADYPDALFMNTSHLNYAGAQRFTGELREQLGALLNQEHARAAAR